MRPFLLIGNQNTQRRRDKTGTTTVADDPKISPRVGGSSQFRAFKDENAIIGESLAGLFVVETFLVEPELFDTYMAFDPSLWWNDGQLVKEAAGRLRRNNPGDITLYLASSSEPEISRLTREFSEAFKQAEGKGFTLHYQPMPVEAHATIYHPAALLAFRALFAPIKAGQ
jgi:predicted alpha/beta superfamily hydrolase